MKKINKEDIKKFWEINKKKIIIGISAAGGLLATGLVVCKAKNNDSLKMLCEKQDDLVNWGSKPSRPIPDTELFKILDIADDVNEGCVTWLDV